MSMQAQQVIPMKKKVYLVDGSGYIFRAFHALPPLTRPDGTPIGAVLGFTNMLIKLINEEQPDCLAVIFDASRETFRNEIYPEYKANRLETPEELIPQFSLIRQACDAFNVPSIEMHGFEADDLIATYATRAKGSNDEVTIVSSDKDLMQLVSDNVRMFDPMKNRIIEAEQVFEKFGVGPERVVDVQALAGDSTDNVPGVPGIGIKTAAELINTYGDLETLLARAGEIKQPKRREKLQEHSEDARISMELVTLKDDVPVEHSIDDFTIQPLEAQKVLSFLRTQHFTSIEKRMERELLGRSTPQEVNYTLIQDIETLKQWIDKAHKVGVVAVDTETTSLNAMQAKLVGVSLSLQGGTGAYIPLGHKGAPRDLLSEPSDDIKQIPMKEALALLKSLLEDPAILKVGQNLKYDALLLKRYDIKITPLDDTMVLSYVLEGGLHGHGMDELALLHLDHETIKYKDVVGSGRTQVTFDMVPLDKALTYAAEDADITLQLYDILKPRLVDSHMSTVYETLERPLIPVLVDMESAGIKVDGVALNELSRDFTKRLADLEQEIHQLAGVEFNVASPKQLGEVLFDRMSLPGGKKGKTGAYSTAASILEELALTHELPEKVLEWRQLAKLKSTYTDALQEQIDPETGRVHTSYAMAVTSTGRLSSSDPNLQNIPTRTLEGRKIRKAFIAKPGYKLMSVDYSQIELRLLAHMADIEPLKQAFRDGKDIHALTASQVFNVPLESLPGELRSKAKAINFGIIYGISPWGLAQQLKIDPKEAKDYIDSYFTIYPGIQAYMEKMKAEAKEKGYVTTLFGRRCYTPEINDRDPNRRSGAERQAINAPLQGSNADIIKRAMIKIPPLLQAKNLDATMLLQVHDELIFEVKESDLEAASTLIKITMENSAHLSIPLVADVGIGDNWNEAH